MSREAKVESELYRLLKNVLEKRGYTAESVRFDSVEPQYRVDNRRADLALVLVGKKPLLIIETKRKLEMKGYYREERKIDPTSRVVIDQALWYAIHCGSPFFATTNGRTFALFTVPERGERFSYEKHRVIIKEITLTETFAEELLSTIAKLHAKVPVSITPLDWAFIVRLRSFVNWFTDVVVPLVKAKARADEKFRKAYERFAEEVGYKPDAEQLAKEMSYVLMNKIVFYKVLERYYKELGTRKLRTISAPDSKTYLNILYGFFNKAVEVTKDFEPVFYAGIYDEIVIPDDEFVLDEINAFIEDMGHYRLEDLGSGVVGYIYEELIPAEERHTLGQFYTPPPIAELITRWAVKRPNDKVLDPGCGSGTFLVKAYGKLLDLKGYKEPTEKVHRKILNQLYAIDINPFPLHLTALELASRYIRAPSSQMNTILSDFFKVAPIQTVMTPYTVRTPAGEIKREISIPKFDVVIANPPYTRWVEIPVKTQDFIGKAIGEKLKDYGLTGGIGNETGIYVHFILYAHEFLKKNGRLGMIISNSWLQSDYGLNFVNFLLDHFKVKAVVDFNQRLFRIPLIATCVLLLEKEGNAKARNENKTIFLYVDEEAKVEEILDALENPEGWEQRFHMNVVDQSNLPKNEKWIKVMFKVDLIEEAILKSPFMTQAKKFFEPKYGNVLGVSTRGGTGADSFFYMTKGDAEKWGLVPNYVYPILVSPQYSKCFTFTKKDWERLRNEDKRCFVFIAHKPKNKLPKKVREYIEWGETTPLVKPKRKGVKPKTANKSLASSMRAKNEKDFYGWYDLVGVTPVQISVLRRAWRKARFILTESPLGLDEGAFVSFVPKHRVRFTKEKIKALLSYLNSTYAQLFVEILGITAGGGASGLDIRTAEEFPLLNVQKLRKKQAKSLAELFDKLELEARKVGGVTKRETLEKVQPVIDEIDKEIAGILKMNANVVQAIRECTEILTERRLARAEEARPGAIKGEEEPRIRTPKKPKRTKKEDTSIPLDRFIR